ncbi:MAG TPA: prenyltransferase/squalene oxidase repeat-containing protein, partial [Planctomycetota bacterium]|nr:prenyltransferase/squalene oxidase repeat-containing protein [Planctomycetota bacterium]
MRGLLVGIFLLLAQESEIQKLIHRLGSSSFEEQGRAADGIRTLGAAALPELVRASSDENPQVREWCLKLRAALEKEGESKKAADAARARAAVEQLIASLGSKDASESREAAESLKQRGDCVPLVRKALEMAETPEFRARLLSVLDAFEPKVSLAVIDSGPAAWASKYPTRSSPRPAILAKAGAGAPTENAVLAGLTWLARHQETNGAWKAEDFGNRCPGKRCGGMGGRDQDAGVTGLALLAFLGSGITPESKDEVPDPARPGRTLRLGECVGKGLAWLLTQQDHEGCIGERGMKYMYNHLMASDALLEAYGMTGSPSLKLPAQKALAFCLAAQNPDKG